MLRAAESWPWSWSRSWPRSWPWSWSRSWVLSISIGKQITVFGVGDSIIGMHFDHLFLDDLVDPKNVNTQDQMKKIEEYWSYLQI
jgi:hypothetical protein